MIHRAIYWNFSKIRPESKRISFQKKFSRSDAGIKGREGGWKRGGRDCYFVQRPRICIPDRSARCRAIYRKRRRRPRAETDGEGKRESERLHSWQPRRLQRDSRYHVTRADPAVTLHSAWLDRLCTLPPRPSASFDQRVRICDRQLARCGAVSFVRSSSVLV